MTGLLPAICLRSRALANVAASQSNYFLYSRFNPPDVSSLEYDGHVSRGQSSLTRKTPLTHELDPLFASLQVLVFQVGAMHSFIESIKTATNVEAKQNNFDFTSA